MNKFNIVLLPVLYFLILGSPVGQWNQYDVPYVSTPYPVVEEMFRIAEVSKDDILYDLGCGDGRIVITAAKKFGCRGVGVDLDPQRIKESRENAIRENVENKVTFIQKDLFEAEISEATVVTLYLLSSVNLKLRPKLLQDLKPGTRIVSHDFSMGEWEADEEKEVFVNEDRHVIYFWIVPADVSGTWRWILPENNSGMNYEMELTQKFNQVWAFQNLGASKKSIEDFQLRGDKLSFTLRENRGKKDKVMLFEGQVNGDNIFGTVALKHGEKKEKKAWKARRLPSDLAVKK
jgi:SAM-dependent methyltransferase